MNTYINLLTEYYNSMNQVKNLLNIDETFKKTNTINDRGYFEKENIFFGIRFLKGEDKVCFTLLDNEKYQEVKEIVKLENIINKLIKHTKNIKENIDSEYFFMENTYINFKHKEVYQVDEIEDDE